MKLVQLLIPTGTMPKTDSYNEPDIVVTMCFKNNTLVIVSMLAKTLYHWPHNHPTIPIIDRS